MATFGPERADPGGPSGSEPDSSLSPGSRDRPDNTSSQTERAEGGVDGVSYPPELSLQPKNNELGALRLPGAEEAEEALDKAEQNLQEIWGAYSRSARRDEIALDIWNEAEGVLGTGATWNQLWLKAWEISLARRQGASGSDEELEILRDVEYFFQAGAMSSLPLGGLLEYWGLFVANTPVFGPIAYNVYKLVTDARMDKHQPTTSWGGIGAHTAGWIAGQRFPSSAKYPTFTSFVERR